MSIPATAIIGLGNPLMADEGIGVRVVEEILACGRIPDGVEVLDLGTGGMQVVHVMEGRKKVVFVDCALMDEPPGTMRRFTPDQVASRKVQTRMSLHEGDLLQTLELVRRVGEYPEEVVIFGIQPERVDWGEGLSPSLAGRMSEYVDKVLAESEDHGR